MPKKLIYMIWFVGLLLFIFVAYSAVIFERKPLVKVPEISMEAPKKNPYAITDVVQNNVKISIIDPSVCNDNPEGYIYFQIGDEVFRYTKNSPIQISWINPGSHEREVKDTYQDNVPEGCKGNPYLDVVLSYSYNQKDELYKKIKTKNFMLLPARDEGNISSGQRFYQSSYQDYLDEASECFHLTMDIDKCIWPDRNATRLKIYKSKSYKIMENPYILGCVNFVGDIECSTFYRLYKSLNFNYSFYLSENEYWEEKEILKFDQYLRHLLGGMQVNDKLNKGDNL